LLGMSPLIEETQKMKKIGRKNFFSTIGKGSIIAAIGSLLPLKYFTSVVKNSNQNKIKIELHPSAVKRNKKV